MEEVLSGMCVGKGRGSGLGLGLPYKALSDDTDFLRNLRTKEGTETFRNWWASWFQCIGSLEVRGRESGAVRGLDGGFKWSY